MNKLAVGTSLALALSLTLLDSLTHKALADASSDASNYVKTYNSTTTQTTQTRTPAVQQAPRSPQIPAPPGWQTTTMTRSGQQVQTSTVTPTKGAATTTTGGKKDKDETYVVTQSQAHVAQRAGWQKYYDMIHLTPGQDKMPLNLVFSNGIAGRAGFQQVRLVLSGHPLASEKDLRNNVITVKLDGAVVVGDNQLTIQALGAPGSSCDWKVTSFRPVITSVSPDKDLKAGADLTIKGKYFGEDKSLVKAWFAVKNSGNVNNATVKTVKSDEIVVTVPADIPGGDKNLQVEIAGKRSRNFEIKVGAGAPEITGCSLISGPPSVPVTIYGKGFALKPSDNEVTIAGTSATVESVTATSITVIIPELEQDPQYNCAIVVKSNGVSSKGDVKVNVQKRFIPNEGAPEL